MVTPDLSVELGPLKLKNPVIVSSCGLTGKMVVVDDGTDVATPK